MITTVFDIFIECLKVLINILNHSFLALIIGAFVGLSELFSRYPWSFAHIARSTGGRTYLLLNSLVSLLAYWVSLAWNIPSGLEGKSEYWRVLIASVFGMAIFRSSFLNIKIGNENIPTGFATIVNIFMKRAERSLDQDVANNRCSAIEPVVQGLTYAASRDYFVILTKGALRSISAQETEALTKAVATIDASGASDFLKLRLLAMLIIDLTSIDLFVSLAALAKKALSEENRTVMLQSEEKLRFVQQAKNILKN